MKFNHYLKACRQRFALTQEELVAKLFTYDDVFSKLDVVTLSRWERGITHPNEQRQKLIIQSFQSNDKAIFPCFNIIDISQIEEKITTIGIQSIIGKHKRFIINFPTEMVEENAIRVVNIKEMLTSKSHMAMAYSIYTKMTKNNLEITLESFTQWALHPSSLFLFILYKDQFFGMLFSIHIKPDIFKKLMHFELLEKDLRETDLSLLDEKGCNYPLGFFAYTEQSASLLILRYYAHLITHQNNIEEVGCFPQTTEGEKFVATLGLTAFKKHTIRDRQNYSYKALITDVLLNKYMLTVLFKS